MTLGIVGAFLLGFWGSLHCVGMCGGIVGILHNSLVDKNKSNRKRKWLFWLAYNAGRIFSYSMAGAIAAFIGSSLFSIMNPDYAHRIGQILSGLFMIAFGLYIAGWWLGLTVLETKGAVLWRKISPLAKTIMPVKHVHQALLLGGLWGWLPCGLVYSALVWMFTLPSAFDGMLYMFAFGLGTLPMLLLMSSAAQRLGQFAKNALTRKIAGVFVILLGLTSFFGYSPMHSMHNHSMSNTGQHDHSQHQ